MVYLYLYMFCVNIMYSPCDFLVIHISKYSIYNYKDNILFDIRMILMLKKLYFGYL